MVLVIPGPYAGIIPGSMRAKIWLIGAAAALIASALAVFVARRTSGLMDRRIASENYTLPNGLQVILHEDHVSSQVAVDLWYHAGSADSPPGKSGLAHLCEHVMGANGSAHLPRGTLLAILNGMGATEYGARTELESTSFHEVVPSGELETALWLESDRMGYLVPSLEENVVATQRDVVRNERRENFEDVPYGRERFAIYERLFSAEHPYRFEIGSHEDVAGESIDDVRSFMKRWYVPSNCTIALTGDFEISAAKALVDRWFGSFPTKEKPRHTRLQFPSAKASRTFVDDPFSTRRRISYAWVVPGPFEPDDAELDLLVVILRGRLDRTAFGDRGRADSLSIRHPNALHAFVVSIDLERDSPIAAFDQALAEQLDALRKEPVSVVDLESAVRWRTSLLAEDPESLRERGEQLQRYNQFTGDPGYASIDAGRFQKISPRSLQDAVVRYLSDERAEIITQPSISGIANESSPAKPASTTRVALNPSDSEQPFPEEPFREKRPLSSRRPERHAPVDVFSLENGVTVYLVEQHRFPRVHLRMTFPGGTSSDPLGYAGQASVCASLLSGGSVTAGANADEQWIEASAKTGELTGMLDAWAKAIAHPGWTLESRNFDAAIAVRANSIRNQERNPKEIVQRLQARIAWGSANPSGQIETIESVRRVTRDLCERHLAESQKPDGATLVVAGDISKQRLIDELAPRLARLGGWIGGTPAGISDTRARSLVESRDRIFQVDIPGMTQSIIAAIEPGPSPGGLDFAATAAMMQIVGGEYPNRIETDLTETHGYAYAPYAHVGDGNTFVAASSVKADSTAESLRELIREFRRIRTTDITDAELERVNDRNALLFPSRWSPLPAAIKTCSFLSRFRLPIDYFDIDDRSQPRAVTKAAIRAAALKHLDLKAMKYLVVGDLRIITDQIAEVRASGDLGPGELVTLDSDGREVDSSTARSR